MRKPTTLAALAFLLLAPVLAAPAPATAPAPAAAPAPPMAPTAPSAAAASPALDAFLASLHPGTALPASGCGPNFCTQAQRDACNQQCRSHGHVVFVGLECCQNCTTLCICGSKPVNC